MTQTEEEEQLTPSSLMEQLALVPDSLQWVIEDVKLPMDGGEAIANAILTGNGQYMSDGSLKDDFGTSGYMAMIPDQKNTYEGKNCVPGLDDEQNSYRSELCGL